MHARASCRTMVSVFSGLEQELAEHMQCWGALVDIGAPGIITVDIPFLPLSVPVQHAVLNRPLDAWRAITQQAHISSRSLLLAGGQAGLVPRLGSGSCFVTCAPIKCSTELLLRAAVLAGLQLAPIELNMPFKDAPALTRLEGLPLSQNC